ncbi:cytochrome c3 family protein [Bryobacter aggregatus]|uniref:cytochrome c3 family protein n=1 Tax=Bryobacter aggregatus TaxID=360054 RepID=UPI0004E1F9FC|nr:cytochrome c3 family protein [Bryobacter aggregatus]
MAQVFHRSANNLARIAIAVVVLTAIGILCAAYLLNAGSTTTGVGLAIDQHVPFSHKHHVADDGIDCRYCHGSVETSKFAGIPSTETCMSCHAQIWTNAAMLEPVRESFRSGKSLQWTRVYDLPDFVYFDHSIHVSKGIGCSSCHGRVDQMPLTYKVNTLYMQWCVECHRAPERHVRPRDQIFNPAYLTPASNQDIIGPQLVAQYQVQSLTDCVTCHR